jgi:hypothetical protein
MINFNKLFRDIFRIAGKYDGRVFGNYVKDVIVPQEECYYTDIDLWFPNDRNITKFIHEASTIMDFIYVKCDRSSRQYRLYYNNRDITGITIYYTIDLPIDDIDVNYLTYIYYDDHVIPESLSLSDDTLTLIKKVNDKQAKILKGHVDQRKITRDFIEKDWKIGCVGALEA